MSAIGVQEPPQNLDPETFISERESMVSRYGAKWVLNNWGNPTFTFGYGDVYKMVGYRAARKMIVRGLFRRIRTEIFHEGEQDYMVDWVLQLMMRPKSGELAIYQLLAPRAYPRVPLCQKLPELSMPIAFLYGDGDWVSREPADKLIKEGKVQGEVFATKNSAHHLYVEAARECASCIIKFAHGVDE